MQLGERDVALWKSIHLQVDGLFDRSLMLDQFIYFSFQPVLQNLGNKGHVM